MFHLTNRVIWKDKPPNKSFHLPFLSFSSGAQLHCDRNDCELVMET